MEAFNLLTTSRQMGQGYVGRIPYSEVSKFCEDEQIVGDDRAGMFFMINRMDSFFAEWQNKNIKRKIEAETKSSKGSTGKPKRRGK